MKMNFNLEGQVKKLAGAFGIEEGDANVKCNLELEYSVEEFLELVKVQKELVPGIFGFVKEMQNISNEQYYNSKKDEEIRRLKEEVSFLEGKLEAKEEEK